MVDDLLCGDLVVCERVEEIMSNILTAKELSGYRYSKGGYNSDVLCDSHEALRAENERLSAQYKKQHEDSMFVHRFFEKVLGESANGRDFSVKVPMMESRIAELEKERDAAGGVL